MFQSRVIYNGGTEKKEGEYASYLSEGNFYLVLRVREGLSKEDGNKILSEVTRDIANASIVDLASFEAFVGEQIQKTNLPSGFDLACGFLKDDIFYIKTIGRAHILVFRDRSLTTIIEGNKGASGYLKNNDIFVLSADAVLSTLTEDEFVKDLETIPVPTPVLFISFEKVIGEAEIPVSSPTPESVPSAMPAVTEMVSGLRAKFVSYTSRVGQKKTITVIALVALFLIFIWSVGLGYSRRSQQNATKKIAAAKEVITQKLNQAEEVAFLNLPRSLILISEAKQQVDLLKKEIGSKDSQGITELEKLVQDKENSIVKKEDKQPAEFFDLTVDSKDARGDKMYLDGDTAAILDKGKGAVYVLSLSKKSLDKQNATELKSAHYVAHDQESTIFFSTDGVYKIASEGKAKKVIDQDHDWGDVKDVSIYNGNVYLLDVGKDEVYKYLVAEGGYSGKNSYFQKGQAVSLRGANSLAIDSSLYIGFGDRAIKYTAGGRDEFKTSFPQNNIQFVKIFTNKDVEKVYGWDKANGSLTIMSKNGTYERQIKAKIFSQANDFVVYSSNAYVLVGNKIYTISL